MRKDMDKIVIGQILAVLNTGETNMFDIKSVTQIALRDNHAELVDYLREHIREYVDFILHGESDGSSIQNDADKPNLIRGFTRVKREENHWVTGFFDKYFFEAKLYDNGSKYGIDGGRISKLRICYFKTIANKKRAVDVVYYDRGWETRPKTAYSVNAYWIIVAYLETLPLEFPDDESKETLSETK